MTEGPRARAGARRPSVASKRYLIAAAAAVITLVLAGAYVLAAGRTSATSEGEPNVRDVDAARTSFEDGDYASAEAELARRVAQDGDDLEARVSLAVVLAAQGRNDEAMEQYRAVIEADPHDHQTLYALGILERLTGDSLGAIKHLESAVDESPKTEYLDDLALTYVQVGRYADAVDVWERAVDAPDVDVAVRAEMYSAMATAYEGMREYEEARAALARAIELTPNDENLRVRLEGLKG